MSAPSTAPENPWIDRKGLGASSAEAADRATDAPHSAPSGLRPGGSVSTGASEYLIRVALEVAEGCASFAKRLRDYGYPGGAAGHDLMARKLREAVAKAKGLQP